jgi:alpha-L-fucosidase 2
MKQISSILLPLAANAGFSQDKAGLKLWYNTSSGNAWEYALPIGNGKLAAIVYRTEDTETIQLNENTLGVEALTEMIIPLSK